MVFNFRRQVGATGVAIVMLVALGAVVILNRLAPSIDFGIAVVLGILAFISVAYLLVQHLRIAFQTDACSEARDRGELDENGISSDQLKDKDLAGYPAETLLEHTQSTRNEPVRRPRSGSATTRASASRDAFAQKQK